MIRDVFSVRRIDWIPVKSRLRCDALGLAAGNRHDEQITVRTDGFHFVGDCSETDFSPIGREIDISRPAPLVRWNIVVRSRREVSWRRASIGRNDRQTPTLAFLPPPAATPETVLRHVRMPRAPFLLSVVIAVPL